MDPSEQPVNNTAGEVSGQQPSTREPQGFDAFFNSTRTRTAPNTFPKHQSDVDEGFKLNITSTTPDISKLPLEKYGTSIEGLRLCQQMIDMIPKPYTGKEGQIFLQDGRFRLELRPRRRGNKANPPWICKGTYLTDNSQVTGHSYGAKRRAAINHDTSTISRFLTGGSMTIDADRDKDPPFTLELYLTDAPQLPSDATDKPNGSSTIDQASVDELNRHWSSLCSDPAFVSHLEKAKDFISLKEFNSQRRTDEVPQFLDLLEVRYRHGDYRTWVKQRVTDTDRPNTVGTTITIAKHPKDAW